MRRPDLIPDLVLLAAEKGKQRVAGNARVLGGGWGHCLPPCVLLTSRGFGSASALGWHLLVGGMGSPLLQSVNATSITPP